jgi:hypothetical protein
VVSQNNNAIPIIDLLFYLSCLLSVLVTSEVAFCVQSCPHVVKCPRKCGHYEYCDRSTCGLCDPCEHLCHPIEISQWKIKCPQARTVSKLFPTTTTNNPKSTVLRFAKDLSGLDEFNSEENVDRDVIAVLVLLGLLIISTLSFIVILVRVCLSATSNRNQQDGVNTSISEKGDIEVISTL